MKENTKKTDFSVQLHDLSSVKKIFGIVSGKGGVGKSIVTSLLASQVNRLGNKVAILDADVTGPSIPKAFGVKTKATSDEIGMYPVKSKTGVEIMSINVLLENEGDPVVWRGPLIANTVKQFYTDVIWKDIDYMFIDLPPGTGDVPLTIFQSLPVDGIIVVTSPQELVSMIVNKSVKMAEIMKIPIVGLVENMSYFTCPKCNEEHKIFGESHIEDIAKKHDLEVLAKIPFDMGLAKACDDGKIDLYRNEYLLELAEKIENVGGE